MAGRLPLGARDRAALLTALGAANDTQTVTSVVEAYAKAAIAEGRAVGVGVGVFYQGAVFHTAAFGLADAASATPFSDDSLFEIASSGAT